MKHKKIILASTSPRRKELLSHLGVPFTAVAPEYEEDMTLNLPPEKLVQHLALGKAESIAKRFPDALVIGSDCIVVFRGKPLGKPKSKTEAEDSQLEILLEKVNNGTKITLNHTDIPKGQGAQYKQGWHDHYFTPMKEYFGSR